MQIEGPQRTRDASLWTVHLEDGCDAIVHTVVHSDGVLRIKRVEFVGGDTVEPTSATFRALQLGEVRLHIIREWQRDPDLLIPVGSSDLPVMFRTAGVSERDDDGVTVIELVDDYPEFVQQLAKRLKKGPAKGQGAKSPDFWREVARLYLRMLPTHGQRVVKAMAGETGKSRNTVSTWVRRAREEGWLSKGTQGKAGGEPGPKLIEWMKEGKRE